MSDALLRVRDLDVAYRSGGLDLPALQSVSLAIDAGEIVGLVGESGSGKSTFAAALLQILARNGRIAGGSIEFGGRDLTRLPAGAMRRVRGAEIAMIFQDPLGSLNPTMTVGRQLMRVAASHPERLPGSSAARRERVIELFEEVGIPDPGLRFDDYPHQFSGGMRQRIMIAMALMLKPALIVADEATSALDVTLQAQILELFREIRDRSGTSILLVSHDLGVVAQTCDRVSVMYAGRIVESATAHELFADPQHPYTRALIAAAPSYEERERTLHGIPGRVPSLHELPPGCSYADRCPDRHGECVERVPALFVNGDREVRCFLYDPAHAAPLGPPDHVLAAAAPVDSGRGTAERPVTDALVTIRGLSKVFDERHSLVARMRRLPPHAVHAVESVDLVLRRGEIVGLVGESGSGKTTLALTLMRLIPPSSGRIVFDGIDITAMRGTELRRLRSRMQMILQDPVASLSPRMRIGALIHEPYVINRVPEGERRSVAELLDLVGLLPELARKFPYQLSGGQARRVSIARALALQPDLIVADEPTSGLDVSAAAGVLSLMKDLRDRLGVTYLLITHDLNVVGQVADRISVMYLGEIVETGSVAAIFDDPVHPYTQGLLAAAPRIHVPELGRDRDVVPRGEMPSPRTPPSGCRFHPRCRLASDRCSTHQPLSDYVDREHEVACHHWTEARSSRPVQTVSLHVDRPLARREPSL